MSNQMSFRFSGPLPAGKFEYVCPCGKAHFEQIEKGTNEKEFKCDQCGGIIMVKDQKDHYHVFITLVQ